MHNSSVRSLPEQTPRVETGAARFGEDWCGVFIRGDAGLAYAMYLHTLLKCLEEQAVPLTPMQAVAKGGVQDLLALLRSSHEWNTR